MRHTSCHSHDSVVPNHGNTMRDSSTLAREQLIHPAEIVEPNIQAWVSYLLSGLDKEFRLDQIIRASSEAEADKSAPLSKTFRLTVEPLP